MEQQENPTTEKASIVTANKVNRVSRLPVKEEDLKNLAQRVLNKWKTDPIELRFCTIAEFEANVKEFTQTLALRIEKGDKRKPVSKQLQDLDKEINIHTADLKVYIKAEKGVAQAEAFFPQFGIERIGRAYKIPNDRDARLSSLKKLILALDEHKIVDRIYGKEYWENILSQYEILLKDVIQKDSEISGKVREKNTTKEEIRKVLSSIMKLMEAHYPDTYEAVWREWGFQKSKY